MNIIIPAPLIYLGAALVASLLQFYFPVSVFAPGIWRCLISAVLFIASSLFMLWALLVMLTEKTSPNPYSEPRKLVVQGPYHYSRHPMYVAMAGVYLAFAFFMNSVWLFVLLLPALSAIHWGIILREEASLESRFAQQYRNYKKRVRRWL